MGEEDGNRKSGTSPSSSHPQVARLSMSRNCPNTRLGRGFAGLTQGFTQPLAKYKLLLQLVVIRQMRNAAKTGRRRPTGQKGRENIWLLSLSTLVVISLGILLLLGHCAEPTPQQGVHLLWVDLIFSTILPNPISPGKIRQTVNTLIQGNLTQSSSRWDAL